MTFPSRQASRDAQGAATRFAASESISEGGSSGVTFSAGTSGASSSTIDGGQSSLAHLVARASQCCLDLLANLNEARPPACSPPARARPLRPKLTSPLSPCLLPVARALALRSAAESGAPSTLRHLPLFRQPSLAP